MLPQPSHEGLACILHKCRTERGFAHARLLYSYMQKNGLDDQPMLGNHLVRLLAGVGRIRAAQQVFDNVENPTASSWHSLINGYVECGMPAVALALYKTSQNNITSNHLSGRTFVTLFKACAKLKDVESGRILHDHAAHTEMLKRNFFVGSALVDMYAKCGFLAEAKEVFKELPVRDVVSWTTLIAGYTENGHSVEALEWFEEMQQEGVSPNGATFVCTLKACSNIGDVDRGRDIHVEIERQGLLERDILVGNMLIDVYARYGLLSFAQQVFDKLPVRDLVTWTALITGYAEHGDGEKALKCFEKMQLEGINPDSLSYTSSVKACGDIGAGDIGRELHAELRRKDLLKEDAVLCTALVDMYAKCGLLVEAQQLFDKIFVRDVVCWNSLISGFAENGFGSGAVRCFEQMQLECVLPNSVSFACSLKACCSVGATLKGREIHARVERKGALARDVVVATALVDMYAKGGLLANAQDVFDKLLVRDVATWNSLITGYAEHDHGEEALKFFEQMQLEGTSPNSVTFVCILKTCGILGATDRGQELHTEIERRGFFDKDLVGNTLVYMYAKCGWLVKAQQIFDKLSIRDAVAWTALMTGYSQLGDTENVFHIFNSMLEEGVKPGFVTFVILLNTCSRTGLSKKSETYFESMSKDYGIVPTLQHYTCLVDLLGRAGQLDKAVSRIKGMPCCPNLVLWHAVMGACKYWGNSDFAKKAFGLALGGNETHYVLQSQAGALQNEVNIDEDIQVMEA